MSTETPTPRELRARADAITGQTKELRRDLLEWHETRLSEIGIARDRAAREQYAAEQSAKSADLQVKRENNEVEAMRKGAAELEAAAAAAEKKGDLRAAEEHRELAADYRNAGEIHAARARQAELDAADLRVQAAKHAQRVVELETQKSDLVDDGQAASEQIDLLEDQARLLREAAHKLTAAEMLQEADPPASMADVDKRVMEVATLEVDAEDALEKVAQMQVDRAKIVKVLPDATFETETGTEPEPVPASAATDPAATGAVTQETAAPSADGGDGAGDVDVIAAMEGIDDADALDDADRLDDVEAIGSDDGEGEADEIDTSWLEEFIEEPAATADLSGLDDADSGFDFEPAEVAFADTAPAGLDDTFDDPADLDDVN